MKKLSDLDVEGKAVLLRGSLNVPLGKGGEILDDFRLRSLLATIQNLTKAKAKVVIIGHLGRPKGKDEKLSLRPVAVRLGELLGSEVQFFEDCIGEDTEAKVQDLNPGEVLVLENLRFYKEERENDAAFAASLSRLGEIYVNDAFDVSHRSHASVVTLPTLLPSAIGIQFEKEIEVLKKLLENPSHPLVVIVGGSKVATKAALVDKISKVADTVLVANLVAESIKKDNIVLSNPEKVVTSQDAVDEGLDIGPKTIKLFSSYIEKAETVFWSGPLGKVEQEKYQEGSRKIAEAVIASGAYSVVGGGHLDAFLGAFGFRDKFSHTSTGGGALMAYMTGGVLSGLEVLKK